MLVLTTILSIAICFLNVHAVAIPDARRSASTLDTNALGNILPQKASEFINRVNPDGYNYTIDIANAIQLDTSKDVKTAGFSHPGFSANPAFKVIKTLKRAILPSPDRCGDSSFINHTTTGSPTANDCWVIADTMQHWLNTPGSPEDWSFYGTSYTGIVWYGTCIFGVHTDYAAALTHIGSQDIRDLVVDSINRFQYVKFHFSSILPL